MHGRKSLPALSVDLRVIGRRDEIGSGYNGET